MGADNRSFDMNRIIFRTVFGSHLYGTNTENSDKDFKGVGIPGGRDILLGRAFKTIQQNTKGDTAVRNSSTDIDFEVHSLLRFIEMCDKGETGAIDMLFAPESFWLEASSEWGFIVANRHRLIHRGVSAFTGYCQHQAAKYGVKGSRVNAVRAVLNWARELESKSVDLASWTENDPYANPITLKEALEWQGRDALLGIEHVSFIKDVRGIDMLDVCGRKLMFSISLKEAVRILTRIDENYGGRAKMAATNQGVDWKALSHALRVCHEARELLETGHITFPCRAAKVLIDVKQAHYPYSQVAEMIEAELLLVSEANEKSLLPDQIDRKFWEDWVAEIYGNQVAVYHGIDKFRREWHRLVEMGSDTWRAPE